MLDFLLPIWNPLIVHPLEGLLRLIANPLENIVPLGVAGALAIIIVTLILRLVLVPLSLIQIRSQRHQMAIQPELKALQKKYKGDREGMAREQMKLYKERGINPAAGCLPLLIQLPILFGMYSAMSQLATQGLTLDQVVTNQASAGQVVYQAERHQDPLPYNQFILAEMQSVVNGTQPVTIQIDQSQSQVWANGQPLLAAVEPLTLTPGSAFGNPNPPSTPTGQASIFLRAGIPNADGTVDRTRALTPGEPFVVEIWVNANQINVDSAKAVVTYDPAAMTVTAVTTPAVQDLAFKSRFLWLPSLGQPDQLHIAGLGIPGLLLILMTISSFLSQRMTTMPTEDPQQQAMMRSMAFMPLMYLFFFLQTPAGLVLYWLVSNVFSMFQQYFTVGLGLLGGDVLRLTGRDLQPAWAHIPGAPARPGTAPALRNGRSQTSSSDGNGRAEDFDSDDTTPALGSRTAGAARRPRPTPGKGRKRGKR